MADETRSSREIERELEQERAELRSNLDDLFGRLTFEDAWERTGRYLRENRSEYSQTLGRLVREKPIALALTAVGIGWLLFGPASPASRERELGDAGPRRFPDRDPFSRPPTSPVDPAEKLPRASEVRAAHRPTSGAGAETGSRDLTGAGSGAAAVPPPPSRSTSGASEPAKPSGTSSPSPGAPAVTSTPRTASASTASGAATNRPPGAPPEGAATRSASSGEEARNEAVRDPSAPSSTPAPSAPEARPKSGSETSDSEKDDTQKPST